MPDQPYLDSSNHYVAPTPVYIVNPTTGAATTGGGGGGGGGDASAANQVAGNTKLDTLHTDLLAATPAGENHLGEIGGKTGVGSFAPAVQAAAYAAGQCIGGKQTITGFTRVAAGTGLILTADVFLKIANTTAIDILLFHADPTASTLTDKAAVAIAAADFDKLSGVIHITDWTALNACSIGQALSVGLAFKLPAGSSDLIVAAVARGAITFASTSDFKVALKAALD